jgi:hypothetical protein
MTRAATKPTFSVVEANRTLPLVRAIAQDIVAEFTRLKEIGRDRRALEVEVASNPKARPKMDALKADIDEGATRIDAYIKELSDLGVELKDPERGLVDFPSERAGRAVWLCWKLGEESVAHWHGMDETFSDRRPIEAGGKRPERRPAGESPTA